MAWHIVHCFDKSINLSIYLRGVKGAREIYQGCWRSWWLVGRDEELLKPNTTTIIIIIIVTNHHHNLLNLRLATVVQPCSLLSQMKTSHPGPLWVRSVFKQNWPDYLKHFPNVDMMQSNEFELFGWKRSLRTWIFWLLGSLRLVALGVVQKTPFQSWLFVFYDFKFKVVIDVLTIIVAISI